MKNNWRPYRKTLFHWVMRIPFDETRVTSAMKWIEDIASAGVEHEVAILLDGEGKPLDRQWLRTHLESTYERDGMLDSFAFSREFKRCASRMCFYENGALTNRVVGDAARLLTELEPVSSEGWVPPNGCEPLTLKGLPIQVRDGTYSPYLTANIATRVDAWLPWVLGLDEPDHERLTDNRVIARCHTPRLNEFLRFLRRLTADHGGDWSYSNMIEWSWIDTMVGPQGINLDAPQPGT